MATIRVADGTTPWVTPRTKAPDLDATDANEDGYVPVPVGDPRSAVRFHHPGSADELQMLEVRIAAGQGLVPHAHRTAEIIYVLEGSVRLGARVIGPGQSVFIAADTLYDLTVAPEGVRFLNFRASKETGIVTKEQFLAERAAAKDAARSAS